MTFLDLRLCLNRTSLTAHDVFGEILVVVEKITFSKRMNGKTRLICYVSKNFEKL